MSNDEDRRIAFGKVFQARGPATAKARSPSVERRVAGTVKSAEEAERRRRHGSIRPHVLCMFEMDDERKVVKRTKNRLDIKETCSWLPSWLDGRKSRTQEHLSLISNSKCVF